MAHADVSGSVLLDRSQELREVLRCLESARAGEGSVVLVEGPGGIGKTELVLAAQRTRHGAGAVEAEVSAAVERANARLSRVEQVKRYLVLDHDWLPGGVELTPTMKLKRRGICERYASEIEALYAPA